MTMIPPTDDAAFLRAVIDTAAALHNQSGESGPIAVVQTAPGILPPALGDMLVLSLPQLTESKDGARDAVDIVRHHSMRLDSRRSAVVFQTLSKPAGRATQEDFSIPCNQSRGIENRPDAVEIVVVLVESDAGQTVCALRIDRAPGRPAVLRDETRSIISPDGPMPRAVLMTSRFHVPLADRSRKDARRWARHRDVRYGDPRKTALDVADAITPPAGSKPH